MRDQVDGYYLAAQIRLVRQVHKGTIMILEGDADAKVFDHFVDGNGCDVEICYGKPNVIKTLDLLEEEGFPGIVAIVDADFDRILQRTHGLSNLVLTDCHDLDLTIFKTSAFDRYMSEHADSELLKRKFNADLSAVRDYLVNACLPLAYCRLCSERRSMNIYFRQLKHDDFVSLADLSIDFDKLLELLIGNAKSQNNGADLKSYIAREKAKEYDSYQLANGHDVAAVLGIALRKLLARRREVHTWAREVEAGLRLAFDWEALKSTSLYADLRCWEDNNQPYRIFRPVS